jgi:hypothetical protein
VRVNASSRIHCHPDMLYLNIAQKWAVLLTSKVYPEICLNQHTKVCLLRKCATMQACNSTRINRHKNVGVFDQVASIAEDVPDAQYHAGMGHLQAGNFDQAKYRWER